MWLLTTLAVALTATWLRLVWRDKYRLGLLSLMLWGAVLMIFVDHVLEYSGGRFLELQTNGLIENGVMLGFFMLIPVFIIWIIFLVVDRLKK